MTKLREIEHGLGRLAAEVEDLLETKPVNLLLWRRELGEVIAELEGRRWAPAPVTRRPPPAPEDRPRER